MALNINKVEITGRHEPLGVGGYVALTTVLILGSVAVTVSSALVLFGLNYSRTAQSEWFSLKAKYIAETCLEAALKEIRSSAPYTGTIDLSVSGGQCQSVVTSQGGQNRTIVSVGSAGGISRSYQVIISAINPDISISSWQELP